MTKTEQTRLMRWRLKMLQQKFEMAREEEGSGDNNEAQKPVQGALAE